MNKALFGIVVLAAALVGCEKKSEPGGAGGNESFKIGVPSMGTDIKQGEMQPAKVTVNRGSDFKQKVKLDITAPKGVTVDPSSATVEAGDKGDIQLKVTAAKDAPLGDQEITVKGTPEKGDATSAQFKIKVIAK